MVLSLKNVSEGSRGTWGLGFLETGSDTNALYDTKKDTDPKLEIKVTTLDVDGVADMVFTVEEVLAAMTQEYLTFNVYNQVIVTKVAIIE